MPDPVQPCACCGDTRWRFYCEIYGYKVWQCTACSSAQVFPLPGSAAVLALYGREYFQGGGDVVGYADYEADRLAHLRTAAARLRTIERYADTKGAVLDVGCATGHFLEAVDSSRARYGLESSLHASIMARRSGAHIVLASAERFPFSAVGFQLVTMWDVIEHLRDPSACLHQIRQSIAQDGLLVLSTGDLGSLLARAMGRRWYLMTPPTHLYYFSRKGIVRLLERAGFRVETVTYESKRVSIRLMVYLAARAMPAFDPVMRVTLRSRYVNRDVLINLYDQMTIFARPNAALSSFAGSRPRKSGAFSTISP